MSTRHAQLIKNITRLIAERTAPIHIPFAEIATGDLKRLRAKVHECAQAGILSGNPAGFIKVIDDELSARNP